MEHRFNEVPRDWGNCFVIIIEVLVVILDACRRCEPLGIFKLFYYSSSVEFNRRSVIIKIFVSVASRSSK